jgi:FkbM family methyltransferase
MGVPEFRTGSSLSLSFSIRRKAAFYLNYLTNKTCRIWWEVKTPKFRMFAYEMIYSTSMALRRPLPTKLFSNITYVHSFRGEYHVRPRTRDIAVASPAFEREDVDKLLFTIREIMSRHKSVAFLDVGADIGTYCITVGNAIKDRRLSIIAYEPSDASFQLLKTNIGLNGLEDRVRIRQSALGNSPETECELATYFEETGDSSTLAGSRRPHRTERVALTRLDDERFLINGDSLYEAVVLKVDCEGAEADILAGAQQLLQSSAEVALLVEDFVEPSIVGILLTHGWSFETKLTPYNSFWRMRSVSPPKPI